jgi:hypothetical protein
MVCIRNICINTLHKGDSIFTNNNNNNNNNNKQLYRGCNWSLSFFQGFLFAVFTTVSHVELITVNLTTGKQKRVREYLLPEANK